MPLIIASAPPSNRPRLSRVRNRPERRPWSDGVNQCAQRNSRLQASCELAADRAQGDFGARRPDSRDRRDCIVDLTERGPALPPIAIFPDISWLDRS